MNNTDLIFKAKDYVIMSIFFVLFALHGFFVDHLSFLNNFNDQSYFEVFIYLITFLAFTFYSDKFKSIFELKDVIVFGFGSIASITITMLISLFFILELNKDFTLLPLSIALAFAISNSFKTFIIFFLSIKIEKLKNINFFSKYLLAICLSLYVSIQGTNLYLSLYLPQFIIDFLNKFSIENLVNLI